MSTSGRGELSRASADGPGMVHERVGNGWALDARRWPAIIRAIVISSPGEADRDDDVKNGKAGNAMPL